MDNSPDDRDPGARYPLRYAPKPLLVVLCWVGAVVVAGWAWVTDEPAGRVLAVVAVLLLGVMAVRSTAIRPRLAAGPDGILVGRFGTPLARAWTEVRRVEVVATSRLGRNIGMLELDVVDPDGAEKLLVFTTLDLGGDPWLVAQDLAEIRGHHRENP